MDPLIRYNKKSKRWELKRGKNIIASSRRLAVMKRRHPGVPVTGR